MTANMIVVLVICVLVAAALTAVITAYVTTSVQKKNAANTIGWKWLVFVWFSLMICGVMICLPRKMKTTERS